MPIDPEHGSVASDSDREAELHIATMKGLDQADLAPLAAYLRSGLELNEYLARDIADAIDGKHSRCRIIAKRSSRGRPRSGSSEFSAREFEIAVFMHNRSKSFGFESALAEAMDKFGMGRTAVTDAMQRAKLRREALSESERLLWDSKWHDASTP